MRSEPLRRKTPPRRSPRARANSRSRRRMDELRPIALGRAAYRCERCGRRDGEHLDDGTRAVLQAHHRLPRIRGGPDTLENLVVLCGPHPDPRTCHGWVHGPGQAEATELGLLIPSWVGAPTEPWASRD